VVRTHYPDAVSKELSVVKVMNTDRVNAHAEEDRTGSGVHVALLWSLTLLFTVRVLGQAIQRWSPRSYLPSFSAFQGSGLQYPLLLCAQVVILALMVRVARRVAAGTLSSSPRQRKFLAGFGGLYMAGSVLRIVIGVTIPAAPHWFKAWIPAFFHLVLAGFVINLVLYDRQRVANLARSPGAGT
jgi:hypothetical protein